MFQKSEHLWESSAFSVGAILYLVGFIAVSLQFIFLRQVAPFVGSSAVVMSIVISIFLAALAMGYGKGGSVESNPEIKLVRNLWISSFLLAISPSYFVITSFFGAWHSFFSYLDLDWLNNPFYILTAYLFSFMFPLVYCVEQTVPLLINSMQGSRASRLAGEAFKISTWGNVSGGAFTTLILMYYLGIAWTITINALALGAIAFYLSYKTKRNYRGVAALSLLVIISALMNVVIESKSFVKTTAYANYDVKNTDGVFYLVTNHNYSSAYLPDGSGFQYIEKIKRILFDPSQTNIKKDYLLIGAGGFSATQQGAFGNNVTYVDIDSQIKEVSEEFFLKKEVKEKFVGEDARSYLYNNPDLLWDVIVVDAYTGMHNIPRTMVTKEFFDLIDNRLKPGGKVLINLLINPDFSDAFSRNIDHTIRSFFAGCLADSMGVYKGVTNVLYTCFKMNKDEKMSIYTDGNTKHEIDALSLINQNPF